MKPRIIPATLLGRTGATVSLAFVLFSAFSVVVILFALLQPANRRGAEDLAALLVFTARVWVELPPRTRPDYQREIQRTHGVRISLAEGPMTDLETTPAYLDFLEQALNDTLQTDLTVQRQSDTPDWLWVDVPVGGRVLRVGFRSDRLENRLPMVVVLITAVGTLIVLLTSLWLVRRINAPLQRMARAVAHIGLGSQGERLPESGPRELADLSRRFNRMDAQIQELLAARTTLLAGISHDLRTPLARMRLELELVQRSPDPELFEGLERDLDEMDRLVAQALEFAHGLERPAAVELELPEFLDGVVADFRHRQAKIGWRPAGPCLCFAAAEPLRRVLANLIDNAIRHGGAGGVRIAYACDASQARIVITDQGAGIPEAQREVVFRPFERLDHSRGRQGGSGLGLAIVKQLCDANGWAITLGSGAGGGLEATVSIPLINPAT